MVRARALFQFLEKGRKQRHAYEEIVFLVRAEGEPSARRKALKVAKSQQSSYPDENGNVIKYTFVQLLDVAELLDTEFGDGTEVYWRVHLHTTRGALVKRLGYDWSVFTR